MDAGYVLRPRILKQRRLLQTARLQSLQSAVRPKLHLRYPPDRMDRVRPPVIEVMDDAEVALMRTKTGAERLRMASQMYVGAFRALARYVRSRHPDWTDEQIHRETVRRMSHGAV